MGLINSILVGAWQQFFWHTRFLYSTDFVMKSTAVLTVILLLYRRFGPEEQGGSFGQSQTMVVEPGPDQVTAETYGGGGGGGRRAPASTGSRGAAGGEEEEDTKAVEPKKTR